MAIREPILTKDVGNRLLGAQIVDFNSVRGRPGGANNDHIELVLNTGESLHLDIYALYETQVKVKQTDPQCSGPGYAHGPHGNCLGYGTDRT